MTRAAIYARFSSHAQREESIEDQVRVCASKAMQEGWDIVATYADEAISGRSAEKRPQFLRMVDDAQKGAFDVLIVYKTDRFARNRYDSAVYKSKLRRAGVELVSATEGVPDGPEGIILESVLEGMAEYYSANLAQNVMRGMEGNALKCGHNGVRVFGYENGSDGLYHVDEEEAEGVRMAFRMASEGARKVDIAAALNACGYRTVRGRKWSIEAVSQMLRQEKYVGTYSWGGHRVEHGMPAIVTVELWDSAASGVPSSGRKKRTDMPADYMLTGKIFDVEGHKFETNCGRGSNGRYYYYYRCRETGVTVRRDEIEGRVKRALADLLSRIPEIEDTLVASVLRAQDEALSDELAAMDALRKRIEAAERESGNLIDLAARLGANDRIAARIKALDAERESLSAELSDLERGTPIVDEDMVRYMVYRLGKCDGPASVVSGFVGRVVIDGDEALITFNILQNKKSQTPEGVWENSLGRPKLTVPKTSSVIPWPGGFAIAA